MENCTMVEERTYHGKVMDTDHPNGCVAMTWQDAERMEKYNEKNGWGYSLAKCLHLLADHMECDEAIEDEEDEEKVNWCKAKIEMIEWRLEDANFHTFCGLLHDGKYNEALAWIAKEYCEMEVK